MASAASQALAFVPLRFLFPQYTIICDLAYKLPIFRAPVALAACPAHACMDLETRHAPAHEPRECGQLLSQGKQGTCYKSVTLLVLLRAGPETARAKVQALQPLSVRYGKSPSRACGLCF